MFAEAKNEYELVWNKKAVRWQRQYAAAHPTPQPSEPLFEHFQDSPALFLKIHKDLLGITKNVCDNEIKDYLTCYLARKISWAEYEDYILKWFLYMEDKNNVLSA